MLILTLVLLPLAASAAAFLMSAVGARRLLLPSVAAAHLVLTLGALARPAPVDPEGWLGLDGPGRLFLLLTSVLFMAASVYAVGYLRRENPEEREDLQEGMLFQNASEAWFVGCMLAFLATMTLVCASLQLGLLWIAIEATTLASAPLIYFHRHHRSLEAAWKYLLLCSVGIGLALLGTFFLLGAFGQAPATLHLGKLLAAAPGLDPTWLRLAFLLLLVGYGTKMGLAPMHSWLPDTHSEAPSVVSALLSGALLNCAWLGILRGLQVCEAAGHGDFARQALVGLGLASMAVAAAFVLNARDFKRLLAYSSVEHMGILALGVGLGGVGVFGSMLHAVNHSLAKAAMFLVAGNLMETFRTRQVAEVRGALRVVPVSGALWLAGALALAGSPPFGLFHSELAVLRAALAEGPALAALYLTLLGVVFVGLVTAALPMAQGAAPAGMAPRQPAALAVLPPLVLLLAALALGLVVPSGLQGLLAEAAEALS